VKDALEALLSGECVVMPTDTVYGLACLPSFSSAISRVFDLKGRPDGKALPILGANAEALADVATFDDRAVDLARRFWPGPLTMVLPRAEGFTYYLGDEDSYSVAVRVPQNEVALELLSGAGPLAVTSANLSGHPPATTLEEAEAIFGSDVSVYVDGGESRGVPSTIVSLMGDLVVLRGGGVTEEELKDASE
jgi:tRNA threonylcarbamoyl adenosine modification protein (Sua5/YciO/YrdC/YwlC family)